MGRYTPPKQKQKRQAAPTYSDTEIRIMAEIIKMQRSQQGIKGAPEGYDPEDPETWG